ncbi:MAG: HEAT repeat domain-containing protein [Planctomycetes bacterium]|nr:HEAT repeat domain-containing protein [Planctomycetota bacterium]
MRIGQIILLSLCGCAIVAPTGAAKSTEGPLPADQQAELQTLSRMLSEADRSAKTRFEAASLLLTKPYAGVVDLLVESLADTSNRPASTAVANAIAETGITRAEFVSPLFVMLVDENLAVRIAAAGALGRYSNQAVLDRLSGLALQGDGGEAGRLAAISALSRMPDKRSIDTLIALLNDSKPQITAAASTALSKLTGIRSFGTDAKLWQAWWQQNENKSLQQWLSDLAESLTAQNAVLEERILQLNGRLVEAITNWYAATPAVNRPALVAAMLKDPLAEIRLKGLELAGQRLAAGDELAETTASAVRVLLVDENVRVRAASAQLAAGMYDTEAIDILMKRMAEERVDEVRMSLISALGALRAQAAADMLLDALSDEPDGMAIKAAGAVARLADNALLSPPQRARAVDVIIKRYGNDEASQNLREALLGAMGILRESRFVPVMKSALSDKVAAIRLEAVRGLQQLNVFDAAGEIAPLTADPDRGVRQAAIAALGALGDVSHLDEVLPRTRGEIEPDPEVRKQAWQTAMELLAKADIGRIAAEADALADQPEARDHQIKLLNMLVDRLAETPSATVAARVKLAEALLSAGRPAEAAESLAKAHAAAGAEEAGGLWLRWLAALLAADDTTSIAHIADKGVKDPEDPKDVQLFNAGVRLLFERLAALQAAGQYRALIALADQAINRLAGKLAEDRINEISAMRDQARAQQQQADRETVGRLVKALTGGEPANATAVQNELLAMRKQAVGPLVEQLRAAITDQSPNPAVETPIIELLAKLAPELTGYDVQATAVEKRKILDAWLEKVRP